MWLQGRFPDQYCNAISGYILIVSTYAASMQIILSDLVHEISILNVQPSVMFMNDSARLQGDGITAFCINANFRYIHVLYFTKRTVCV